MILLPLVEFIIHFLAVYSDRNVAECECQHLDKCNDVVSSCKFRKRAMDESLLLHHRCSTPAWGASFTHIVIRFESLLNQDWSWLKHTYRTCTANTPNPRMLCWFPGESVRTGCSLKVIIMMTWLVHCCYFMFKCIISQLLKSKSEGWKQLQK